jgi:hypothetical protein
MQYEFEDFRPKNPKDPGPWLTWVWPREHVASYLWRIMFWTVLVPLVLFGAILTPLGFFFQLIVIDYFTYLQYKNSIT